MKLEKIAHIRSDAWMGDIAFDPDMKTFVIPEHTCPNVGGLYIWDIATFQKINTLAEGEEFRGAVFTPDNKQLVVSGKTITIWDVESGSIIREIPGSKFWNNRRPFLDPSLERLVCCNGLELQIWDFQNAILLKTLPSITYVAENPNGRVVACSAAGGKLQKYDMLADELTDFPHFDSTSKPLAYSPDGKLLAVGADEGTIQILDSNTGHVQVSFGKIGKYWDAVFSSDGSWLFWTYDAQYRRGVWNILTQEKIALESSFGAASVYSVISPNGEFYANIQRFTFGYSTLTVWRVTY